MKSFRHELEDLDNPVVEKDILHLAEKIHLYKEGKIPDEKFRALRLARGVYGQRQQGVQMIRIKIPYGKLSVKQLLRIASVSDEYSNGNLHVTTRQDVQIHYVALERTPQLWAELEKDGITLREACGNTVRNITASPLAGIDPEEPFDVSPYAQAMFEYFLRNPVGQELGRKFKIAFSSSEKDSAYTFIHDAGFIPKIKIISGKEIRGFKVVIGGGLGAQPYPAQTAFEFLEAEKIIPFTESLLRVFDRYGERSKRNKARFKYLLEEFGLEKILELAKKEEITLAEKTFQLNLKPVSQNYTKKSSVFYSGDLDIEKYDRWLKSNVFEQKQKGYYGVFIKLQTGNFNSKQARVLAEIIHRFAADDIRFTIEQNILLKFVTAENLPALFHELDTIGFARPGANSTGDITACPGTDTCNLGIASSYGITRELEKVIAEEYHDFLYEKNIKIKISGCMNSCGQHGLAQIGFHGSTIKSGNRVAPALQLLLGGGSLGNGEGIIADKVIKFPSRRGPDALRILLDDFSKQSEKNETFNSYYQRKGKIFFYDLLKPVAEKEVTEDEFIDWGHTENYRQAIGVGECAGVVIDLVGTMLFETEEKLDNAKNALKEEKYSDSIYYSYSTFISGAKAVLVNNGIKTNSQAGIISDFEKEITEKGDFYSGAKNFSEKVYAIHKNEPSPEFAFEYYREAEEFYKIISVIRKKENNHVNTH